MARAIRAKKTGLHCKVRKSENQKQLGGIKEEVQPNSNREICKCLHIPRWPKTQGFVIFAVWREEQR